MGKISKCLICCFGALVYLLPTILKLFGCPIIWVWWRLFQMLVASNELDNYVFILQLISLRTHFASSVIISVFVWFYMKGIFHSGILKMVVMSCKFDYSNFTYLLNNTISGRHILLGSIRIYWISPYSRGSHFIW